MKFSLDRRLIIWWLLSVVAVICAHFIMDYFGLEKGEKGVVEAAVTASLLLVPFFLVRRKVLRPLGVIREAAYKIISGDLSARANVARPPEIKELAETVNAMVTKLEYSYRQILDANVNLEKTVEERTHNLTIEHGKLSAIFKSIPDGVIFLSVSGEIIEVNPMMSIIWGIPAEELKGKTVSELPDGPVKESLIFRCNGSRGGKRCWETFNCVHKNCPAYMSDDLRCWLISGTYCHASVQVSVKRKLEDICSNCEVYKDIIERYGQVIETEINGRQFKISSSLVLDENNKVRGEIKTFYDVTGEKLLEKRKTDFISLITHDLKSPLTSIMGYSDLLLEGASDKLGTEEKGYLTSIKTNGAKILELVEQYLELTRIEAGMMSLDLQETDPVGLLQEAVSGLDVQAMEKNIKIHLDAPDGLPLIKVDRGKMLRVITNLVSNSIKYTMSGGCVEVSAQCAGPDGAEACKPAAEAVEIIVADNGYGMDKDDLPHIFDRYYRSKSISGIRGTGLGLAVVKSLVDAHGGEVSVESELGKGSKFTVTIPVKS
jgi:signal transduction histidine kinase/HAMP domain-containing protein